VNGARAPIAALRQTTGSPALARVQGAWALLCVATWIYTVAIAVYAYRIGGAADVAAALLLRTLPSVVAGPLLGAVGDRRSRSAVMTASAAITALAIGATVLAAASDVAAAPVYLLGVLVTVPGMAFRAAQSAAMPALARDARDLAAANVVTSTVESTAVVAGPAAAAVLLALGGHELAFIVAAALAAAATVVGAGLRGDRLPDRPAGTAIASTRDAAADPTVRLVLGLLLAQTFVSGAFNVLVALLAIEQLDIGESGVGLLMAAFGAGGVAGSLAAFTLTGSMRLAAVLTAGMLLWGVPLMAVGVTSEPWAAVALVLAVGLGNVLFDVSTVTLLQRTVPDSVLARVFGTLETVVVLGLGLGAAVTPLLVQELGVRGALVTVGAVLPALALLLRRPLIRANRGARIAAEELAVLRRVPVFAGLPAPVLENLALHARRRTVAAGTRVITQGDRGEEFYAIASGSLRVTVDGDAVAVLGPGQGAGEIALLRDVPRIATVDAIEDTELLAVRRDPFITAVTGHAPSLDDANAIVAAHMAAAGLARRAR
jgi:MFS family permease